MNQARPILALLFFFSLVYLFLDFYFGVFHQPYLWDELGVYSRASIRMYQDGLSLLPSAIPDELSRGHPLLCPFYFALAFKLFGCTPLVGHLAAVLLNMTALVFFFLILRRQLEAFYAMLATMAIFIQPMFLSQSLFILPETMLMLWTISAVYFYLIRNINTLSVTVLLALFTKESALILPLAFLMTEFLVKGKNIQWSFIIKSFFAPIALLALFFIIQYNQRGYFFYPLHTDLVKMEWYFIHERLQNFRDFAVFHQGHLLFIIALAVTIPFCWKYIIRFRTTWLILPIIVLGGIGFIAFNYFLSRYTLYFMLPFFLSLMVLINKACQGRLSISLYAYILFGLSAIYFWKGEGRYTDVDFSYVPHLRNLQDLLTELDEPEYKEKSVYMGFPLAACYWEKENGYERQAHYEIHLDTSQRSDFKVYTFPGNMQDTSYVTNEYEIYERIGDSSTYSIVYRRRK